MADNGEKKTSETNHPSENTTNDNQMTNQDQTQTGIPDDKKEKIRIHLQQIMKIRVIKI
ncbi:hypothetical protein MPD5_0430 [Melissococcus plutonius DAT561]|nr:hypothetical protein MPD5_0430 [Melissococcus plutonius DAT561]